MKQNYRQLCLQVVTSLNASNDSAQRDNGAKPSFPNLIGARNGKSVLIPDKAATAIASFGESWLANHPDLLHRLSAKDINALVQRAFADAILAENFTAEPDEVAVNILHAVCRQLAADAESLDGQQSYICGCWLVRDQPLTVEIGPVRFEPRERWLDRMISDKRISEVAARRIRQRWTGKLPRKRRPGWDAERERAIVEAIGECPDVCSTTVSHMAVGIGEEKAFLTARLALMAIALLWERPSKALEGFGLLIDGERQLISSLSYSQNRETLVWGRSARKLRGSTWMESGKWPALWKESRWLRNPCAAALNAFADARLEDDRPSLSRSIFLALWWFYEGCNVGSSLMATVKFGAVLDVLSNGKSISGIERMIEHVLRIPKGKEITRNGQTVKSLTKQIYGIARSETLHGLNDRFGHDWANARELAEVVARDCLAATIFWAFKNPNADQLPDYFKLPPR